MYKKITKQRLLEGMRICKENGYWSKETTDYINSFDYPQNTDLSQKLGSLYNSKSFKASSIYELAKENNLI